MIEVYGQNVKESRSGFDNYGDPDGKLNDLKKFISLMMRDISIDLKPEYEIIHNTQKFFALLACGELISCLPEEATHYTNSGIPYWAKKP